jgi:integrase-like protein
LVTYVYPIIGALPVDAVEEVHVMQILQPIWNTKTETASRVRGRIEKVLDRAKALKLRAGENPARWTGHLDQLLPRRSQVAPVKHHEALLRLTRIKPRFAGRSVVVCRAISAAPPRHAPCIDFGVLVSPPGWFGFLHKLAPACAKHARAFFLCRLVPRHAQATTHARQPV